ncbi:Mycobacterial persistence regulator A [Variovorax sp. SRS16]|uniref:response regulator transcription factor n=1 Tax=Variovorax sp. SRS16 TaxID=282217 RepID=UPI001318C42E|nr:response regulator transcription factor [Variovorax sp. SRS16]VTU28250.1 Mycobacterial persistence regulator A [Variovorax sp. SRS16]
MNARILVVEDDLHIAALLGRELVHRGYDVQKASTGAQALGCIRADRPALMLLDLGLPDMEGSQVLRQVREAGSSLPVIVLTARDEQHQRIDGLRAGADDYVVKPFDMAELDARIQAVLRRGGHPVARGLNFGALTLQPDGVRMAIGGAPLTLTPREFQVLRRLMNNADHVVTKAQLQDTLTGFHGDTGGKTVEVYLHRIRQKIAGHDLEILTIRGFGYLLRRIPFA